MLVMVMVVINWWETFTSQVKVCKLHLLLPDDHDDHHNDDHEDHRDDNYHDDSHVQMIMVRVCGISPEQNIFQLDVPASDLVIGDSKVWSWF